MSRRIMGAASFMELQDSTGRIQVYVKRDEICPGEDKTMYNTVFKKLLDIGDIAEHWSDIDVVATDPPYGRSTRTGGEKIDHIYARSLESISDVLRPGGCAGIVLPHEITSGRLSIQQILLQRVHSSLTRHYHLFRK